MKKKLCVLCALLMVASVAVFAAGCGDSGSSSNNAAGPGAESSSSEGDAFEGGGTASADDSLNELQKKGQLVLGCDDEFPPMGFRDATGNLTGFDIELAQAVADRLGVELIAKPIDWSTKEMELTSGNIDVIWNGYSITEDRNKQVEFTKPYLANEQLLVVKASSDIQTKGDLSGKIVGVQSESAALELLAADTDFEGTLGEVREYGDYQDALLDLKSSSRIDAVGVDKILIEYVMLQEPGTYRILDESLGSEYFGIGLRQGSVSLREAIDNVLDEMQKDGTTDAICEKWFTENIVIRDVPKLTASDF
ncbi:MAG: amino acid ABC transporter substrate-binding protein [Clostridiales Family XIII bacterium]|jgi:polar amino acid transport system substrate-binding protein|nr:amino acid ABC transporter substrate-binding protein [Clostridiales Family XIII bacterium]